MGEHLHEVLRRLRRLRRTGAPQIGCSYWKQLSRRRGGGKSDEGGSSAGEGEAGTSSSSSSEEESSAGSSSSSSGSTSGGSSVTAAKSQSSPVTVLNTHQKATPYGSGGGSPSAILSGEIFPGRMQGGGTRDQIFGTRTYGSGYPGISGRGVANRGFPFFFWPLSFEGRPGNGAYLQSNIEYGHADNSSRPGGGMTTSTFSSAPTAANASVFRILADDTTTGSLLPNIFANCSRYMNSSVESREFIPYNETGTSPPQPEQIIQYHRASSIALSLDGYNNTSIFEADGTPDVPLPSSGIDTALLDCLNQTIGAAAPLITSGGQWTAIPNNMGLLSLVLGMWLSSMFL
ncbi:hypothetical protein B0H16DRAFT_1624056 [Mycena metata]|uniref:Uncharacterized protein n=1 Tax=Mycena metata TaxID=1033252 RepID=A0AAD7H528_9AGAR|nr:hypothetical protein B0H16DRAFT_1624056 [Mycena metata]